MTKYEEFLEHCNVISKDKFNEILGSFSFDVDIQTFDDDEPRDCDIIAQNCIRYLLDKDYDYAYVSDINYNTKSVEIRDVESIKVLDEIKDKLKGWTISNYNELKNELKEEEKANEFAKYILKIQSCATLDQLKEFCKQL